MSRTMLAVLGMAAMAACARGDTRDTAAADSLNRDLQLAPVDTTRPLNDRPADTAAPAAPAPAATTTRPRPTTTPPRSTTRPTTPAPSSSDAGTGATPSRSLAAGTTIPATTNSQISSHTNKVGETVTATVSQDVKDASGRVVVPSGSTINLRITQIHESENKSDSTGTLALAVESVEMNGKTYPLDADVLVTGKLVSHGVAAGDVAKVGAGAAAGAIVGRVLGGSKGTIIGGVLGGAVGAQRAVETKDRDIVVESGSPIRVELRNRFTT
ncbi:MAG TPA: hypothetical protein VJ847_11880 [Gemmatimonadales bacterium]|nr:hypothetical protein [Gemmatimonadales bacterium]